MQLSWSSEHISFPHWYCDPMDFHEMVVKTIVEIQKIKTTPAYIKCAWSLSLWYAPLLNSLLDPWFLVIMIQLLADEWHDRLCIVHCDYTQSYFHWVQCWSDYLLSPFATTQQHFDLSSRFWSINKELPLNTAMQYAMSVAQLIVPLKSVSCFTVWTQNPLIDSWWKPTKETTKIFRSIDDMLNEITHDKRCAILVVGDAHLDQTNSTAPWWRVFDSICTTLERPLHTIPFKSVVGKINLLVA